MNNRQINTIVQQHYNYDYLQKIIYIRLKEEMDCIYLNACERVLITNLI